MSELEDQIRSIGSGALSLAVARYLHDHRFARWRAGKAWLDDETKRWSKRDAEEIGAEATRRLDELDRWVQEAQNEDAELYETRRIDVTHARMNLQSARSGSFATAAGPLADFLRDVGEKPETLRLG